MRRLNDPRAKLVISHPAGDEGSTYMQLLRERIDDAKLDVRFIFDRICETRAIHLHQQTLAARELTYGFDVRDPINCS